jgi:hypothetical protein
MKKDQLYLDIDSVKVNYIFEDTIDRVFELYRNPAHFVHLHIPFMTGFKKLTGDHFDTVGTTFEFIWKQEVHVESKIIEVIDEVDYKMIKMWFYKVDPTEFTYHMIYKLKYITADQVTLLTNVCEFGTLQSLSFYQLQIDHEERLMLLRRAEGYLKTLTHSLVHEDAVVIEKELAEVWDVVTNIELLCQNAPICDRFERTGPGQVKIFKDGGEVYCVENKKTFNNENSEYMIKVVNGCPETQIKELLFKFVNLGNKTLLVFTHIFYDPIPVTCFRELSLAKQKILSSLKRNIS